jgi:hypothetical protein
MMTPTNAAFATHMKIHVTYQPAMEMYTELMRGMDTVHFTRGNVGSPTVLMRHLKMAAVTVTKTFAKS